MWAEINGERKKVACGPCIRGHRSSKCDHQDRVLVEVRKPGRPLSSCPHPSGSCSCERVVINYTIPKTSECACPSERSQSTASTTGSSNRVQKNRSRKSNASSLNPAILEKAISASQDAETDTSSITRTSTEHSNSNNASPPSSASSTPRLEPKKDEQEEGSCCQPKSVPEKQSSCCTRKEPPKPVQKSCCSGKSQQQQAPPQTNLEQGFGYPQLQQNQVPAAPFGVPTQNNYTTSTTMPPPLPFGFSTPIYNHMAFSYPPQMPIHPHAGYSSNQTPEHNCHCGDKCSCFGCAAHPHNATMTEYLRVMHHYMSTGGFGAFPPPTYDLPPAYPHQPGYGAEANFNNFSHFPPSNFSPNLNGHVAGMMGVPNTPVDLSNPWQQSATMQPPVQTPTATDAVFFRSNSVSKTPLKNEDTPTPLVAESPEADSGGTPTLSPSSYFWQEIELPGCNDETGTCQCGDGCECVGCLTHGGHNGLALGVSTIDEHGSFPEFHTGALSEAPT